jgi:hypothetical protein
MMEMELTKFTPAEGRKFGLTVGGAFAALATLLWWRDSEVAWKVLATIGALLMLGGLLVPGLLGPIYRGWMRFALALSKITTPIIMGIIYFGLFLITGVLRRTLGHSPMVRERQSTSYWAVREHTRANLERLF